jgi:hypothetical protein
MGERVVIRTRFRGPPNSAQGGYTCGLLAGRIDGAAEVSLRSPPPLDAPLEIRAEAGDRVVLLDGGELVADGRPSPLELEPPRPVTLAEAEAGSAACPWIDRHPLPQCFGCGPDRDVPDGLRLLPGPVVGREVWAAPWTPDPSVADEEGVVQPTVVWAALDCPTSFPTVPQGRPCVLARMRARLESPVRAGGPPPPRRRGDP